MKIIYSYLFFSSLSLGFAMGEPQGNSQSLRKLQTPPANDVCEDAIVVPASDLLAGTVLEGSTIDAGSDSIRCFGDFRTGVYYRFAASGARYKVTTCHEGMTDYDSVLVVDNDLCDSFGCTDFQNDHDFDCDTEGLGATVEFYSEPETFYTVYVGGVTEEAVGNFGVSIQEFVMPENNICEDATLIEPTTDDSILLTASTANATYNNVRCEPEEKLAVFYKFLGTGGPIRISTCNEESNFNTALALFDDVLCNTCAELTNDYDFDCDELGMGSTIEFLSQEDVFYTLAVWGVTATDKGEFGLIVQQFVRPENDVCTEAIRIEAAPPMPPMPLEGIVEEDADDESLLNTSVVSSRQNDQNATNMTSTDTYTTTVAIGSNNNSTASNFRCLSGDFPSAFYTVVGTGQRMRVSTCTADVDLTFDSVIHVYTGLCDPQPSACSAWTNDRDFDCPHAPSGFASTVEWETEPDILYTIAVRGITEDARGDFGLSLEAFGNATTEGSGCRWVQVCDEN